MQEDIINNMCEIEIKRAFNVLSFINHHVPLVKREGKMKELITLVEGTSISGTEEIGDIHYLLEVYEVNDLCRILNYSYWKNGNKKMVAVVSIDHDTLVEDVETLMIDERFQQCFCERQPVIDLKRITLYFMKELNGRKDILSNSISSVRYRYKEENGKMLATSVSYYPDDSFSKKGILSGTLKLQKNKVSIYSKDGWKVDGEQLMHLLTLFCQNEPRNIVKINGYYDYDHLFKLWTPFLEVGISNQKEDVKENKNDFLISKIDRMKQQEIYLQEEKRFKNLISFLKEKKPTVARKGILSDLIRLEEGKNVTNLGAVAEKNFLIQSFSVNVCCSLLQIELQTDEGYFCVVGASLENRHATSQVEKLMIDEQFCKYLCERMPRIDIDRVISYLMHEIFNPDDIFGNRVSNILYYYEKEKEDITLSSVSFAPYNRSCGENEMTVFIDVRNKKIWASSSDYLEFDDETLSQLVSIFYEGESRNLTKMNGYYGFSRLAVRWTSFLEEESCEYTSNVDVVSNKGKKRILRRNDFLN